MTLEEYAMLDATAAAAAVREGRVSASELLALARSAAEAVDPTIAAIVEMWPDPEPPLADGPFAGVPMLLKDMGAAVPGRRMELGSRLMQGWQPGYRSELVEQFRRAGLVPMGRTAIPEFAAAVVTESAATGATRNPFAPDRSTGGSSGGSAAAVAAGIVPIAHATDAAGSIRVPAAHTGLVGLKPSRGAVSWAPDPIPVDGLAVPFVLTRSVRDARALFAEVATKSHAPENRPLRILHTDGALGSRASSTSTAAAAASAAEILRNAGHAVITGEPDLGVDWRSFAHATALVWARSTADWIDALGAAVERVPEELLEPQTRGIMAFARSRSDAEFTAAEEVFAEVANGVERLFAEVDVVLSPTTLAPAPRIGEFGAGAEEEDGESWLMRSLESAPLAAPANVTGTPALSVPGGFDEDAGVPVGVQLWGGAGVDSTLLQLAAFVEEALPWRDRRPAIWAGGLR